MRIGVPGDPSTAQQTTVQSAELTRMDTMSGWADPTGYYKWLSTELKRIHEAVKIKREKVILDDKTKYDWAHKAVEPIWKVCDKVLDRNPQ